MLTLARKSAPPGRRRTSLQPRRLLGAAEEEKEIYMDTLSTTRMDGRVLDAMMPYLTEEFANPHSAHVPGTRAMEAVDKARQHIATLINSSPEEIIFTSGATESDNLAVKGVARAVRRGDPERNRVVTTAIEHKAVLESVNDLEKEGFEPEIVGMRKDGIVDLDILREKVDESTAVVSVHLVNNEIGTLQPIKEASLICRNTKAYLHTDAAQAVGKIPVDMKELLDVDLLSMSSHKLYGPKGIGALYIRSKHPEVPIEPLFSGGEQERGLRSGTLSPALVVGFGKAAELARLEMSQNRRHVDSMHDYFLKRVTQEIPHIVVNGSLESKYKGCLNICFKYIEGEALEFLMQPVAVSTGSACTSEKLEPSFVLDAIGVDPEHVSSCLRFGFDKHTRKEDIDHVVGKLVTVVKRLREMSPKYEAFLRK